MEITGIKKVSIPFSYLGVNQSERKAHVAHIQLIAGYILFHFEAWK